MGLFKVPKAVLKKIIQIQRNFFWGSNQSRRGIPLISWEVIQKPKHLGGLGVGDLVVKNAALLFKWWWRYLDDGDALWKKVISSNHYLNQNNLVNGAEAGTQAGVWVQIMSVPDMSSEISEVISRGLWRRVGRGNATLFWEHKWLGDLILKDAYPRLYNISNQKNSLIMDMGFWDGHQWRWAFNWRRDFMQWEIELYNNFWERIQQHELQLGLDDAVRWRLHPSAVLTTKSFCNSVDNLLAGNSIGNSFAGLAWNGLAPPRAEILIWFVLQKRLNTRERLAMLKIIPPVAAICPFCVAAVESVSHILFDCSFSWKIWSGCFHWWEMNWCCQREPLEFFQAWCGIPFRGIEKKMWISLFYVVVWSLWNIRNRVVFEGFKPVWEFEDRQVKVRWAYWLKAWMSTNSRMIEELQANPSALRKWRWFNRGQ